MQLVSAKAQRFNDLYHRIYGDALLTLTRLRIPALLYAWRGGVGQTITFPPFSFGGKDDLVVRPIVPW